jgi:hypothetical protein
MHRKDFLQKFSLGSIGLLSFSKSDSQQPVAEPLPVALVKDFVVAGHGNLDKVKQMLAETPSLLYATYDWGKGDFETALEGAGHVGNKQIANWLIEQGARTNLFVLTMLGKTDIVKPFLEAYPVYINAKGPHGFTLLHHAQKGGEPAKDLLQYLESKGLKDTRVSIA